MLKNEETRDRHKLTTLALLLRWVAPRLFEQVRDAHRGATALMHILPAANPAYRHVVVMQREMAQLQQRVQYLLSHTAAGQGRTEDNDLLSFGETLAREIVLLHEALSYAHHQMLLAQGKISASDPLFTDLMAIHGTMKKTARLVTELLVYYETPSPDQSSAPETRSLLNLVDVVKGSLDLLVAGLSPHIELQSELPAWLPLVAGESGTYRQMVMELLINAVEALENEGGTIRVATGVVTIDGDVGLNGDRGDTLQSGDYVCFVVADDGPGMEKSLFDKVFTAKFSTKGPTRGRGLLVVRSIARQNGGAVRATCEQGHGTAVRIYLPIGERRGDRARRGHVPTVHVADNDRELRQSVMEILAGAGFQVDEERERDHLLLNLPKPRLNRPGSKGV